MQIKMKPKIIHRLSVSSQPVLRQCCAFHTTFWRQPFTFIQAQIPQCCVCCTEVQRATVPSETDISGCACTTYAASFQFWLGSRHLRPVRSHRRAPQESVQSHVGLLRGVVAAVPDPAALMQLYLNLGMRSLPHGLPELPAAVPVDTPVAGTPGLSYSAAATLDSETPEQSGEGGDPAAPLHTASAWVAAVQAPPQLAGSGTALAPGIAVPQAEHAIKAAAECGWSIVTADDSSATVADAESTTLVTLSSGGATVPYICDIPLTQPAEADRTLQLQLQRLGMTSLYHSPDAEAGSAAPVGTQHFGFSSNPTAPAVSLHPVRQSGVSATAHLVLHVAPWAVQDEAQRPPHTSTLACTPPVQVHTLPRSHGMRRSVWHGTQWKQAAGMTWLLGK